jgi:hypothetical protein
VTTSIDIATIFFTMLVFTFAIDRAIRLDALERRITRFEQRMEAFANKIEKRS